MRKKISFCLSVTLVLAFLLLFDPIIALSTLNDDTGGPKMAREGNRVILSSDGFNVEVNAKGTVPFYHFNTTVENTKFFLKFDQIVQYNDTNNNDQYDSNEGHGSLSLASVEWSFELISESATNVEFAFRSTNINKQGYQDTEISLINHFTGDTPGVKFDIELFNWPFTDDSTALALEFSLTWARKGGSEGSMKLNKEANDTMISLQNNNSITLVLFESISNVEVDGELQEDAALLYDNAPDKASGMSIFICYPRFNNNLTHDPAFASTNLAISGDNNTGGINGFLTFTSVVAVVITSLIIKKKKLK